MNPLLTTLQFTIFKLDILLSIFCDTKITLIWTIPPHAFLDLRPIMLYPPTNFELFSTLLIIQYFEESIPTICKWGQGFKLQ